MKTAKIRRETFNECWEEMGPLFERQWEELALFKEDIPLSIDYPKYKELEDRGLLFIITARVEGVIMGYSVFFINNPLHYSTSPFGMSDVIWVDPVYRQSGVGAELISQTERLAKKKGAKWFSWRIKPRADQDFSPYLATQGYVFGEKIMMKVLKED
jgi:GNAT superfamily N-acetyltransferase